MFIKMIKLAAVMAVLCVGIFAQSGGYKPADSDKESGVVFKIPEGTLPMDWKKSGFKGLLMLEKENPSGVFAGYPNDRETVASFKERAVKFITPMFAHEPAKAEAMELKVTDIPAHDGDSAPGQMYVYTNSDSKVQVLFYERSTPSGAKCIYGYFASVPNNGKSGKIWADEQGRGVKLLEKFSKSFKN